MGFGSFASGHGHTEMVLAADTIFFSVYINDGYVYAQDSRTGKDKWRFQVKKKAVSTVAADHGRSGSSSTSLSTASFIRSFW